MKNNNFRGDLTDISAKKEALFTSTQTIRWVKDSFGPPDRNRHCRTYAKHYAVYLLCEGSVKRDVPVEDTYYTRETPKHGPPTIAVIPAAGGGVEYVTNRQEYDRYLGAPSLPT